MAATKSKRGQLPISIFQSGTSGHNPVTNEQVMKPLYHYWPQARDKILKSGAMSKIIPEIDISFYGHDEFEAQFQKMNVKKNYC